jgi:hypothetical protein
MTFFVDRQATTINFRMFKKTINFICLSISINISLSQEQMKIYNQEVPLQKKEDIILPKICTQYQYSH